MSTPPTFLSGSAISAGLEQTLRRMNPWWENLPPQVLPPHRRHLVGQIKRRLATKLAPIIVVRGARQIGKTTSQLHVLTDLLESGIRSTRILRVQFDDLGELDELGKDPVLRVVDWFEHTVLKMTLNEAARRGEPTYLFFDEVQNLSGWAPQLKALVDSSTTQVVVTGSSALRIELGRDSLAGRISTIEAGVLSLTEIGALRGIAVGDPFLPDNGISVLSDIAFWKELTEHGTRLRSERDQVFSYFSDRGGYPMAHANAEVSWEEVADQLNETVIRRVIQHDLRVGDRGRRRDAVLLEEVFRLVCRYAGQAPALHTLAEEARGAFDANLGDQRVRQYVKFLADALLVRAIEPLEIRLKKKRGSPKLCLVDHALRASWLQERVPLALPELRAHPDLGSLSGRLAESTVGALLSTIYGLDVAHVADSKDQAEIDFVITVGLHRIPIEVKYQATIDPVRDVSALKSFMKKSVNHAPFALLVTQAEVRHELGPDVLPIPLSTLMLVR